MQFSTDTQIQEKQNYLVWVLSFILWVIMILTSIEVLLSDKWSWISMLQGLFAAILLLLARFTKGISFIVTTITFVYLTIFSSCFIGLDDTVGLLILFAFFMIANYSLEHSAINQVNKIQFIAFSLVYYFINLEDYQFDLYDFFNIIVIVLIIGMVIYTAQHYEKEVNNYRNKLEASNKFLQEITDINPQLIFTKDKDRKFNFVNNAMASARNIEKEAFYNKTDLEIGTPEAQAAAYEADDRRVLNQGVTIARPIEVERSDGTIRWYESIKKPILDEKAQIVGLLAVTTNITKLKEKELELLAAKKKAEESDQLKSAFLANMSHEIRTPMNSIVGFSELLLDESFSVEEQKEYLQIINQNCQQLLHIVSDILDISKLETGQVQVVKSSMCVNYHLLKQLQYSFLPQAKAKHIDFRWDEPSDAEFYIFTDTMKVRQILTNLLSNAIKYTDKGSVVFGYELMEDAVIRFFVKDSGIGIPGVAVETIFNRFQRTEKSMQLGYKGTGLGLAISRGFARLLEGDIYVKSVHGEGSTFYFDLPYEKAEDKC